MKPADDATQETEVTLPGAGEEGEGVRTPTDHILTGQEGEEAMDSAEIEAAMAAGWKKVDGDPEPATRKERADDAETDITDVVAREVTTEGDGGSQDLPATGTQDTPPPVSGRQGRSHGLEFRPEERRIHGLHPDPAGRAPAGAEHEWLGFGCRHSRPR
jgi:hypothetical protein